MVANVGVMIFNKKRAPSAKLEEARDYMILRDEPLVVRLVVCRSLGRVARYPSV